MKHVGQRRLRFRGHFLSSEPCLDIDDYVKPYIAHPLIIRSKDEIKTKRSNECLQNVICNF